MRRVLSGLLGLAGLAVLAACGTSTPQQQSALRLPELPDGARTERSDPRDRSPSPQPVIHTPADPLQCVPYARAHSGIEIYGDAWTWWASARGRYTRGREPRPGAVVVMQTGSGKRGHVAVVRQVRNSRVIVVDHANWLNRGRIHRHAPMVDVSRRNDWSAVRVWYTPGGHLGGSVYPVRGFIYPEPQMTQAES